MTTPRQYHHQLVHYIRKTVNYNDSGVTSGVYAGTLPSGAQIIDAIVNIETAFNAGTNNNIFVGTNAASYNNIVAAADVAETIVGGYRAAILTAGDKMSADADVFVKYSRTGTPPTAGIATVVIVYAVDNDL